MDGQLKTMIDKTTFRSLLQKDGILIGFAVYVHESNLLLPQDKPFLIPLINHYKKNQFLTTNQLKSLLPMMYKYHEHYPRNLKKLENKKPSNNEKETACSARIVGNKIKLRIPNKKLIAKIKRIPGRVAKKDRRGWYWNIPLNLNNADMIVDLGISQSQSFKQWYDERTSVVDYDKHFDIPGLNGELYQFQSEGVQFIESRKGRAIVADDMGLGKSQRLDTDILTPNGFIKLKDLSVGDYVIGSDGKKTKVTGIFPQGKIKNYEIVFSDGSRTNCCENHLWAVNTATRNKRGNGYLIKTLADLVDEGYTYKNGQSVYYIPMCEPIKFTKKKLKIDPYFLGVLISDGGLSQNSVILTTGDDEILNYVKNILPKGFNVKKLNEYDYRLSYGKNNPLISNLKEYNLMGKLSHEKSIPKDYLLSNINDRIALLQGLIDTDGYISKDGCVQYSTSSEKLSSDIKKLVQSLGGVCRQKIKKVYLDGERMRDAYISTIRLDYDKVIPCRIKRRLDRLNLNQKYKPSRAIRNIRYVGEYECACISVEAENSLYLTDECIVTHNTLQSIGYLQLKREEAFPAVIVVPASVKLSWKREIETWMSKTTVSVLNGRPDDQTFIEDAQIYIVNYDILANQDEIKERTVFGRKKKVKAPKKFTGWQDHLLEINPKTLICDECHYLKNMKSKRYKAVNRISKACKKIIMLSGTIIENRPIELYPALEMIDKTLFTSFKAYKKRYCGETYNGFGYTYKGSSNELELNEKLTKSIMIRRLKKDVAKFLPPKQRIIVPLELDNRAEYERCQEDTIAFIQEHAGTEAAARASRAKVLTQMEKLKQLAVKGKIKMCIKWIDDFIDEEKLVVFCTHTNVIKQLVSKFKSECVYIDGSVSQKDRQKAVDKFQTDPDCRLFVGNLKAAGVGITLTAASATATIELGWVPGLHDQAEDRVNRIGQEASSISAYYLLADDTIDIDVAKMLDSKRKMITGVLDGTKVEEDDLLIELMKKYGSQ